MTKTKMILLNNLAECLLRLGRYRDAEQRATEVLQIDERDLKAMWRRGRARVRLLEVQTICRVKCCCSRNFVPTRSYHILDM